MSEVCEVCADDRDLVQVTGQRILGAFPDVLCLGCLEIAVGGFGPAWACAGVDLDGWGRFLAFVRAEGRRLTMRG